MSTPECPAPDGSSPRQTSFNGTPPMCIDPSKSYTATMETSIGTMVIHLDAAGAPNTVNKCWVIQNSAGDTVTISQGTGANVVIPNGGIKMVVADGAGAGAAGLPGAVSAQPTALARSRRSGKPVAGD